MTLRIVHCLRAPVGGLFRHVVDLAAAQAARGHQVGIVADATTGGEAACERLARLAASCSLGIERIDMPRLPGIGDVAAISRVSALVRRLRPDVIHGHGAKGGLYARLSGTRASSNGRPARIYTPHGGSLHYRWLSPGGWTYLSVERYLRKFSDIIVFESEFGRSTFTEKVGSVEGFGCVVHNGVAPSEFEPVTPERDASDFVFVGELRKLKGVDVLLRALARIDRDSPPTAAIVGAGPDAAVFRALAGELDLGARTTFPGPLPARQAFAMGRCLVVPSRAESLPYIVLEGGAAGIPLIAARVGGMAEIFGEQAGGLVPPDDPAALAQAMDDFLDDPDGARNQASRLKKDIGGRFSLDAMTDGVMNAYADALSRRSD